MLLSESEIFGNIEQQLNVVYFALIWSCLAIMLAWKQDLFKSFRPVTDTSVSGIEVVIGFCLFIVSQVLIVPQLIVVFYYLTTGEEIKFGALSPTMSFWINVIIVVAGYIPLFVYYVFLLTKNQKRSIIGDNPKRWYHNYLFGASTWFFIFPLILLWSKLIDIFIMLYFHQSPTEQLPVEQVKMATGNPIWILVMGITTGLIVPIAEEFLFRGLLQSWIKKKLRSPILGIILASFIFAVFHFSSSQNLSNIQFISSIFLLSCFLGFLYEREKSLWASIGLHSIFNTLSVVFVIKDI